MPEEKVIAREPEQVGGHTAVSKVSDGYDDTCVILSVNGDYITSTPDYRVARQIAGYAITPNGGYGSVVIEERPGIRPDALTFERWLFRM
ncbi:hypothetical protein [Neptuniibacter halophilus]|uniref:hypothetical protein n=1 Tax=Neptuniibacter halophilus TaxID=651666 RepID=UPI002573B69D|nr:hypothetical protein [Neptuniibacter halophilus]